LPNKRSVQLQISSVKKALTAGLRIIENSKYARGKEKQNFKKSKNGHSWVRFCLGSFQICKRSVLVLFGSFNKTAELSQRRPRDAPNIWVS